MTSNMKCIVYEEYGNSSVLKYTERPRPEVGPDDVLIQTKAAGVNPVDFKIREHYIPNWPQELPIIPGWDVAGVVDSVGANVKDFKAGDHVYAYTRPWIEKGEKIGTKDGCSAEFVSVPQEKVAAMPTKASFEEAGSIPLACLTAFQGVFDHGKAKEGDVVLVLNASGGVGSFAVQLLAERGVTVLGTCSGKNAAGVTALGASKVYDYTAGDVGAAVRADHPAGVDLVFDCVGGESCEQAVAAVRDGGAVVSIAHYTIADHLAKVGRDLKGTSMLVAPSRKNLETIAALFDAGKLKVSAVKAMKLEECAAAHDLSATHRVVGKIVLTC